MSAPNASQLDPGQVLKGSYDDGSGSLRVNVVTSSTSNPNVLYSLQVDHSTINGSGGAITQLIASTSASISKIVPNEQTGVAMNIYMGGSGSEVLLFILAPGQDNEVEVNIPAATRISIRAAGASAPTAGSVYLTFIG